jgi:hypothetical protein
MRRIYLLLVMLLLVAACAPVTVTPTVIPTDVPGVTPEPTTGANPHGNLPAFSQVNKNWTLDGHPTQVKAGNMQLNHWRILSIPPLWDYMGEPDNEIPPFYHAVDCVTEDDSACYKLDVSYIGGTYGLEQHGIELYGNQTYIVKVRAAEINLAAADDHLWTSGNVGITGRLIVSDGTATELYEQAVPQQSGVHEWFWVIRSTKRYPTVVLQVWFRIRWATAVGYVMLDDIEVLTAPENFGQDVVLPFDVQVVK